MKPDVIGELPGFGAAQAERQESFISTDPSAAAHAIAAISITNISEAVRLARQGLDQFEDFDQALIEFVESVNSDSPALVVQALHMLEVIEQVLPRYRAAQRLLEIRQADHRIISRITLILGRLTRSPKWLKDQEKSEISATQGNSVECSFRTLREANQDSHHRIAASAILGLYQVGDPAAILLLDQMLRHDTEVFRRAAIWTVSQTTDCRYLPALKFIARNGLGAEKAAAAEAIQQFQMRRDASEFEAALALEITSITIEPDDLRTARLHCIVEPSNRCVAPSELSPLNFVIQQGHRQIMEYSLHPVAARGAFVAVTILPTPARCLSERAAELWAHITDNDVVLGAGYYSVNASPGANVQIPEIVFAPIRRVDNLFGEAAELLHYPCDMNAVLEAALLDFEHRSDADMKLVFLVVPAARVPVSDAAIELAARLNVTVHAVVSNRVGSEIAASLRQLTDRCSGSVVFSDTAEPLKQLILSARARHFASIELRWHSVDGNPNQVKIAYSGSLGYAEADASIIR